VFRRNRRREDAAQPGLRGDAQPGGNLGEPDDELDAEYDDELDEDDYDDEIDDDEIEYEEDDEDEDEDEELAGPARPGLAARVAASGDDLGDPATWTRLRDSAASPDRQVGETGPWDAASGFPESERMDFGSLLVPVREGFDIQVNLDEEAGIWIAVVYGDSGLQLQAFAAPKRSGIWDEVRQEIAEEVARSGGTSEEIDGPFGPELRAKLTPEPGQPPATLRFMGADGPRWFLRGLISGPAAARDALAAPFEELFADVVVVRGDHAEPPRKPLDIALPDEARQAIEQQMEADGMPNPFERGPEITEIR
jgi:hypothetical protein